MAEEGDVDTFRGEIGGVSLIKLSELGEGCGVGVEAEEGDNDTIGVLSGSEIEGVSVV